MHRGQRLLSESNVMGIHLRSNRSQVFEDSGDITSHLDIQTDMTEIHVCLFQYIPWLPLGSFMMFLSFLQILKEDDSSILEILKVVLTASVDAPMQVCSLVTNKILKHAIMRTVWVPLSKSIDIQFPLYEHL